LDVWRLESYIGKLKSDVDQDGNILNSMSMGSAQTIRSLDKEEIECSICLERILDGNTLIPDTNNHE